MSDILSRLPKLPTPEQMRQWDKAAVEFGIPDFVLMENAGKAIFDCLQGLFPQLENRKTALFMGSGNNGGDAACLARHLLDAGARPLVFHVAPLEKNKGSRAEHARLALADGVDFVQIPADAENIPASFFVEKCLSAWNGLPEFIVDGLLGTGFSGQLKPAMLAIIEWLNHLARISRAFVLSIDTPSGLNALDAKASPLAVKANATVSLAAGKIGLLLPAGREYTGQIYVRDIGMPRANAKANPADYRLLDGRVLLDPDPLLENSYKNVYGHIVICGGARGLAGAAHLSASASLRSGVGLVTVFSPAANEIKMGWPEIMTLAPSGGEWPESLDNSFLELAAKAGALVVGPGMGRGEDSLKFLKALLEMPNRPPTVFDADALMLLGSEPSLLDRLAENDILTPHPGEAGALLHCAGSEIQRDRMEALRGLEVISKAVAVLKGAGTLIGQKGKTRILCPYDIPQLAIGGAGDVLSGIMGAMLARGKDALSCAARAVIIHVIAGLILAGKYPCRGALASELANATSSFREYLMEAPQNGLRAGIQPWP